MGISAKGKLFDSQDCVQTEANIKMPLICRCAKPPFSRMYRHSIYIYIHLPDWMGVWECHSISEWRGTRVYPGPNLRNTGIYPDTEIFASMLSTITRRTSSRERRAIFQATAGYIRIYTRTHIRQFLRHMYTGTRRKPTSLCWHLEHLPNAIRSRACTRDSDDTWVSWNLPHTHIILSSWRCMDILVLVWNRYVSRG